MMPIIVEGRAQARGVCLDNNDSAGNPGRLKNVGENQRLKRPDKIPVSYGMKKQRCPVSAAGREADLLANLSKRNTSRAAAAQEWGAVMGSKNAQGCCSARGRRVRSA